MYADHVPVERPALIRLLWQEKNGNYGGGRCFCFFALFIYLNRFSGQTCHIFGIFWPPFPPCKTYQSGSSGTVGGGNCWIIFFSTTQEPLRSLTVLQLSFASWFRDTRPPWDFALLGCVNTTRSKVQFMGRCALPARALQGCPFRSCTVSMYINQKWLLTNNHT